MSDELVIKNMADGRYELCCPICKISIVPEIPCPVDKFLKIMREFEQNHNHPNKPMDYIQNPQKDSD